jgi:uncharacterized flavoprotein (TIGR03862 family)
LSARPHIAVVGGGPAGLRAAEVCATGGARVSIFDHKRSVGRKLLVAGYGGLNLTHGEPLDDFVGRYRGPGLPDGFAEMIRRFPPAALREWAAGLGIATFEQRTGRVYPRELKAAPLLRRWVERLRGQGVEFHVNQALTDLAAGPMPGFNGEPGRRFDAVILALGGASWPETGSDGRWTDWLGRRGVVVHPLVPANCGWETDWPPALVAEIEGRPLKNLAAGAGDLSVRGEIMLTRYGVEGGAIYQLGPALREMESPAVRIDLKPDLSLDDLLRKMESVRHGFADASRTRLRLPDPAILLLDHCYGPFTDVASLCRAVKGLTLPLTGPRPVAEAISSAGGIAWSELDDKLMLHRLPGVFACGEMIDWEAPTGGYLLQACFATATRAAQGALAWITRG